MTYKEFCDTHLILKKQDDQENTIIFSDFELEINVKRQFVQQIHAKLFELDVLTNLILKDFDHLSIVPEKIAKLTKLECLELNKWIRLETIPHEVFQLKNLRIFKVIRSYQLKNVPQEITKLSELEILDLSGCKCLESLPESIGQLKKLRELRLARCEQLKKLPDSVRLLDQLECLHLSGCINLILLPDFTMMGNLVILHLSGCMLSELPESMKHLRQLEILHLSGNVNLRELPLFLLELKFLEQIYISGCHSLNNLNEFKKYNKRVQIIQRTFI